MLEESVKKKYADKVLELAISIEKNNELKDLKDLAAVLYEAIIDIGEEVETDVATNSIKNIAKPVNTYSWETQYDSEYYAAWRSEF